jgi:hypothetical protein
VLGHFNVDAMLDSAPSSMLTEWRAFTNLHPVGEWRADLRSGIIAQTIANVNRDSKQTPEPYKANDFMPDFLKCYEPQEPVDLTHKLLALAKTLNAKRVR